MVDVVIARPLQPVEVDEYVPMEECEDEWVPEPGDDEEKDQDHEDDGYGYGGYNPGNGDTGGQTDDEYLNKIQDYANTIQNVFSTRIRQTTLNKFSIIVDPSKINQGKKAVIYGELYRDMDIVLYMPPGLTDIQMKLILVHEYAHLMLFDICRIAGRNNVYQYDLALHSLMKAAPNDESAQHQYMGNEMIETFGTLKNPRYADILRLAFPNESEEFYEYGQWGGGATDAWDFQKKSDEEKLLIGNYLENIGLIHK